MIVSNRITSSTSLVTKTHSGRVVIIYILLIILCETLSVTGGLGNNQSGDDDADKISSFPHQVLNSAASWPREVLENNSNFKYNKSRQFSSEGEDIQGKSRNNSSSGGHFNNISDYIRNGELSAIFCERCTDQQKKKVEQILYLLYNFNNNAGGISATTAAAENSEHANAVKPVFEETDKNYVLLKKKRRKFKATSSPIPAYRKNLPEMIPTPETFASSYHLHQQLSRVIQLPSTLSTTTPATSSTGYSSMAIPIVPYFYSQSPTSPLPSSSTMAIPIVPYFYSQSPTSPLPSSSTTMSSAMEPLQSVEMPTPPMPPTTTGPIYLYYLGGATSSSSSSSSGSLEPPSTPVVEYSVAYASKPTTMEPLL